MTPRETRRRGKQPTHIQSDTPDRANFLFRQRSQQSSSNFYVTRRYAGIKDRSAAVDVDIDPSPLVAGKTNVEVGVHGLAYKDSGWIGFRMEADEARPGGH